MDQYNRTGPTEADTLHVLKWSLPQKHYNGAKKKGKNEQRSLTKRSKDRPFKKRYWSNSHPHAGKKKNLDTDLTPFVVMNSKRITVQMWTENSKTSTQECRRKPQITPCVVMPFFLARPKPSLGFLCSILDTTPEAQSMKEITDKLDFVKIKNMCPANSSVHKIIQAIDWGKIVAKHVSGEKKKKKDQNPQYVKSS